VEEQRAVDGDEVCTPVLKDKERELHKHAEVARCQRFMPVILATWEVEMGRIKV
jgi:hypothetical protein